MNAASNIGSNSLAVFYSFAMVSALLLPKWSIQTFGCKNVLLAGMIASCCYIASNVYLCVETMVAASILYGVVISPYISAQSLYVNEMAIRFQLTTRNNIETVMAYFFGIYAFFLESSQVSGNIISYFVRSPSYVVERRNSSVSNTCGINFDSENSANITNANLLPPPEIERIVLISIFVAMGILAVILAGFFLESVMSTEKNVNGFQFICPRPNSSFKNYKGFFLNY
ncbi:UNC93-like protein [Trichonephila inaurata madagascariensis]|uniref:UNC93-like protein n=1 Tax=Trichonephila inaurata madagascariensis TaxID=2747483 RepID=A0A8X6WM87_9ARAC|nr:UNC93-like protein [Trichonephila inaurata madagascariensis]